MKKALLFAATMMIAFSSCCSCNDKCKTGAGEDSTKVDSTKVDSAATAGDSIVEDVPGGVPTNKEDSTIAPPPER